MPEIRMGKWMGKMAWLFFFTKDVMDKGRGMNSEENGKRPHASLGAV